MQTKYPIERFVDAIENPSHIPAAISEGIRKTVEDFVSHFENLNEAKASQKPAPDKWSAKEILGHLIDSATNNHQRFVRAQYEKNDNFIRYAQMDWVNAQKYNSRAWKDLLFFWKAYNFHLAHIIDNIPMQSLDVSGMMGSYGQVTIGYLIVDYLGHMQHHLRQIERL